jgi:hypothetical protein
MARQTAVAIMKTTRSGNRQLRLPPRALPRPRRKIAAAPIPRPAAFKRILGSVAENVVRNAPCPVLVVRQREHEFMSSPSGCESGDLTLNLS